MYWKQRIKIKFKALRPPSLGAQTLVFILVKGTLGISGTIDERRCIFCKDDEKFKLHINREECSIIGLFPLSLDLTDSAILLCL